MPLAITIALTVAMSLFGPPSLGCVSTAECDEHVGCAAEQVCYDHRCLSRCQTQEDCLESQTCTPCIDEATRAAGGRCTNEDALVCLEGDSES